MDSSSVKKVGFIITTVLFAAIIFVMYFPGILTDVIKLEQGTAGLILLGVMYALPLLLSIVWSALKSRYLFVVPLLVLLVIGAAVIVIERAVGQGIVLAYIIIAFISCAIAICMDKGERFKFLSSGSSCYRSCDCDSCHGMCY